MVNSLYKRATGYEFEEECSTRAGIVKLKKVMHADVTACIFWLKNRQRKDWAEKVDAPSGGETHYHLTFVSPPPPANETQQENRVIEMVL